MTILYNCKPPSLLFRNNGVQSPDAYLDSYGVPDWSTDLQRNAHESLFNPPGPLPPEKQFLYGTIVEEICKWYQDVYTRHGMTGAVCGTMESFTLPDGSPIDPPAEGGSQFNGRTLHSREWWKLMRRNRVIIDGRGPLTQSQIDTISNEVDYHFTNENNAYFTKGKMSAIPIRHWLWPYNLPEYHVWSSNWYTGSSVVDEWEEFLTDGTLTRVSGSNVNPPTASYRQSVLEVSSRYAVSMTITMHRIEWWDSFSAATWNTKSIRHQYGMWGDGRNAAMAIRYGASNGGVFKVGLFWLRPRRPGSPTFPDLVSVADLASQTTFFHTITANAVNVIEFPDAILDQTPPTTGHVPYLVFAPDLENPPPSVDETYSVDVDPDIDMGQSVTGYPHNYPLLNASDKPFGRLCSDDVWCG